ncbi:hypothetical protein C0J52_11251 [Blattella germanica]|nr:hypothetical protein C0J52_11251 [Blattella germanica]
MNVYFSCPELKKVCHFAATALKKKTKKNSRELFAENLLQQRRKNKPLCCVRLSNHLSSLTMAGFGHYGHSCKL